MTEASDGLLDDAVESAGVAEAGVADAEGEAVEVAVAAGVGAGVVGAPPAAVEGDAFDPRNPFLADTCCLLLSYCSANDGRRVIRGKESGILKLGPPPRPELNPELVRPALRPPLLPLLPLCSGSLGALTPLCFFTCSLLMSLPLRPPFAIFTIVDFPLLTQKIIL